MFHISSQKEIFCSIIKPTMVSYLYRRSILHPLPDERVCGEGEGVNNTLQAQNKLKT